MKQKLPFKSVFSLDYLIQFWKESAHVPSAFSKIVQEQLSNAPELSGNLTDPKQLETHAELFEMMMSVVAPPGMWHRQFFAIASPFNDDILYKTPSFEDAFLKNNVPLFNSVKTDAIVMDEGRILSAYTMVLRMFYGLDIHLEFPVTLQSTHPKTGLSRYYKLRVFPEFMDVIHHGTLKPLSNEDLRYIQDHLSDIEELEKFISIDEFEFRGFVIFDAVDITDEAIMSELRHHLFSVDKELNAQTELDHLNTFEMHIRNLLKEPNIHVGTVRLLDKNTLKKAIPFGRSFLLGSIDEFSEEQLQHSIFQHVITTKKMQIINDTTEACPNCCITQSLTKTKIKNVLLAPILGTDNEVLGVLEIISDTPRTLHEINAFKLKEIMMLLSITASRGKEELDSEIDSVIKQNCTAIHPSVEWRFKEEALTYVLEHHQNPNVKMNEVVFEDVYPLYGVSDIRNSSDLRNKAIQDDLLAQLKLAKKIIEPAFLSNQLPYLDELLYRIEKYIRLTKNELSTRTEVEILEFLQHDVEHTFSHIKHLSSEVALHISTYLEAVDNEFGMLYYQRKKYATSVSKINTLISRHLNTAQKEAQRMFPHYFEHYKTDGVEHEIYIGESLTNEHEFSPLYLKNLRLWQLVTMCTIVQKSQELLPQLEIPLETAHLILVQDMPLTIRFRSDEKRFDVDGAYNIRYEMVKKRIDKAEILGTGERITQPGKIAIIYNQPKEYDEYIKYIKYLKHSGFIQGEIESYDLEQMQGVSGLKALRFSVNTESAIQSVAKSS